MQSFGNSEYLTLREAIRYAGVTPVQFWKYVFKGGELKPTKTRGKWMVEKRQLEEWKLNRELRVVRLYEDDYIKSFNFAVKQFYLGGSSVVEWGTTKRREIGEYLFNQAGGKLGELALHKFLLDRFRTKIEVSFEKEKEVHGRDITRVIERRNGGEVSRAPKVNVSIKTTKIQNFFLWVVEEDIDNSDAYVMCRVDLPPDHIFRVFRDHEHLSSIRDMIPELGNIEAEVVGFVWKGELKARGPKMEMIAADGVLAQRLKKPQYVVVSGELRRSMEDWKTLAEAL